MSSADSSTSPISTLKDKAMALIAAHTGPLVEEETKEEEGHQSLLASKVSLVDTVTKVRHLSGFFS